MRGSSVLPHSGEIPGEYLTEISVFSVENLMNIPAFMQEKSAFVAEWGDFRPGST